MRTALLFILGLWAAPGAAQEIGWLKLDQAKAVGAHTGKLILVYVACDPRSGSAPCSGGVAERAFADAAILKRQDDFHYVRVCEKKTAQSVKSTRAPEVIFLDPDGDEVYRSDFKDGITLDRAMTSAVLRYAPRDITWGAEFPSPAQAIKPLLVVGFDDEKGETLKAFEDKTIAKFHDRIEFVRLPFKKDGEAAKKWGVGQAPAIFICDASKEAPEKNALEKIAGKKTPAAVKAAILRAIAKLDPKK